MAGPWRAVAATALVVLLLAALASGVGLLAARSNDPAPIEIALPAPTATPVWKAYISGAVNAPGVYVIRPGNRAADLLEAAEGPSADADLARVNLALRLEDEAHVHIPAVGEALPTTGAAPGAEPSDSSDNLINVNTASAAELEGLPGIGPVLSQAILRHRQERGPFQRVEDLLEVSGIGPRTLDNIRDRVTVG